MTRPIFILRPCDSCLPIFGQFRILLFPYISIHNILIPIPLYSSIYKKCSDFHEYETWHTDTIAFLRHYNAKYESSPIYIGIKLYNHFPGRLKSMNADSFMREVNLLLINGYNYSVKEFLEHFICWIILLDMYAI